MCLGLELWHSGTRQTRKASPKTSGVSSSDYSMQYLSVADYSTYRTRYFYKWSSFKEGRQDAKYDLSAVLNTDIDSADENELRKESQAAIATLIKEISRNECFLVTTDVKIDVLEQLSHIFVSDWIIPDVFVYKVAKGRKVPILLVEMDSCKYQETLSKMELIVTEHLRWLRHFNEDIDTWSGFVFPNCKIPNCVCQVEVVWQHTHLRFHVDFVPLKKEDVNRTIEETLKMSCSLIRTTSPS